jgi:hypothetical protein
VVNLKNYPPQSGNFIGIDNNFYNIVDKTNSSLKMSLIGDAEGSFVGDAFGRLRVSDPRTINDYKFAYIDGTDFTTSVEGSGNISYDFNLAESVLSIGETSGVAIQQTKMYHNYMPGKSQLIFASFCFGAAVEGVTKRVGYFGTRNGLYLRQNGDGTLTFVIRSDTSGTVEETEYNQTDWSGEDVGWFDATKTQILFIDFEWLGVGRVRFGFNKDGRNIVAGEIYHANNLDRVYMRTANLPVRYEISGTGPASIKQICSTVVSEGGYFEVGRQFSAITPTAKTVTTAGFIPILAIRLKNSFNGFENRVYARYATVDLLASSNNVVFEVVKLPSAAGLSTAAWTSAGSISAMEYDISATTYSTSSIEFIDTGLVPAGGAGAGIPSPGTAILTNELQLRKNFIAQNFDSTDSEVFAVIAKSFGGNATVVASITWKEVY